MLIPKAFPCKFGRRILEDDVTETVDQMLEAVSACARKSNRGLSKLGKPTCNLLLIAVPEAVLNLYHTKQPMSISAWHGIEEEEYW